MTNADALLIGRLQDANAKDITDAGVWQSNRATSIKKNGDWVKRQLTFKTSKTHAKSCFIWTMNNQLRIKEKAQFGTTMFSLKR